MAATTRKKKTRPAHSPAEQFLLDALRGGPLKYKDVLALGRNKGLTPKMLRTARQSLGVVSERVGGMGSKGWHQWTLQSEPK